MISKDTIQQITSRIQILDVVGEFVKLKKRGTNYLGVCPFHNEKTPSFTVSPAKEIYKCFGCGKSGNAISFIMEHEKLSYVEALKWLAAKYGITVEETETSPEYKQQQQTADSLFILNQFAREWFTKQLTETEEGKAIGLSYLKEKRGFTDAIIQKFQLGYSLEQNDAFYKTAVAAKYNPDILKMSGLVNERDGRWWDNYRGRVIFPVHNHIGKVIGFGARILKTNDKAPKYINTPENELYVKHKILYGIYFARQEMDKRDECLLVEGYTDVISLHQAGVENVVASGGTSLTQDQLRLIHRYTKNLTILYDGDAAGIKAAIRGLDMALEEGLNVQLVLLPDKEDPDSYVQKVGKEAFNEYIKANKKDFMLFRLQVSLKDVEGDSQKKSALVNSIAESIAKIDKAEDFTKQQDYIKQSASLLNVDETGLTTLVNNFIREKARKNNPRLFDNNEPPQPDEYIPYEPADEALDLLVRNELQERALVKCLLLYGYMPFNEETKVADYVFEALDSFEIENTMLAKVADTYKQWYQAGLEPTEKSFLYIEDKEMQSMVISLLEFPYELSPNWEKRFQGLKTGKENAELVETTDSLNYFKLRKIKEMLVQNQNELANARDMEEQIRLMNVHKDLKTFEREITSQMGNVILK